MCLILLLPFLIDVPSQRRKQKPPTPHREPGAFITQIV